MLARRHVSKMEARCQTSSEDGEEGSAYANSVHTVNFFNAYFRRLHFERVKGPRAKIFFFFFGGEAASYKHHHSVHLGEIKIEPHR